MAVYKDQDELLNTDWQAKINEAVASGDLVAAAQYEAARNDKINSTAYTGKVTQTTDNYSQYLKHADTNYHQDAIDAAIAGDWDAVTNALNLREEKVSAQGGNNRGKSSAQIYAELMDQYGKKTPETVTAPAYSSQYSSQIDSLLNAILNREEFSYDHTTDPSYQAYEQQYKRLGDRAREDTLGDIAGLTGGYASSWAASAASQAQNDYNQQLSAIIPELREAAYNRDMNEYNMDVSNLGLLMNADNIDYGRYRDTVADSQWAQEFDYTKYRDEVSDDKWQTEFDYMKDRDAVSDSQWAQTFDWNKTVDQWNMDNTEAQQKIDNLMQRWQLTGVADEEVAAAFGVPAGSTTESYYFNKISSELDAKKVQLAEDEFNWNKDVQNANQLLDRWQISGVADEEIAKAFGVPVGATTESYYFKQISSELDADKVAISKKDQLLSKWQVAGVADVEISQGLGVPVGATTDSHYFNQASSDLDKEKLDLTKKEQDAAIADADPLEASIARNAASKIKGIDGYDNAAKYILSAVTSADEYFRVGKMAGIPEAALESVFDNYYNQALQGGDEVEQNYTYYAALMGQQEDPEAWLSANKYSIPADILEDLYKLLDY